MAVVIDHQRELLLGYQEDKILLQGDIFIQMLIHITVDAESTLMLSSMEILRKFYFHRIYNPAAFYFIIKTASLYLDGQGWIILLL